MPTVKPNVVDKNVDTTTPKKPSNIPKLPEKTEKEKKEAGATPPKVLQPLSVDNPNKVRNMVDNQGVGKTPEKVKKEKEEKKAKEDAVKK